MAPFAEALRATFQPCTLLLVASGILALAAGRMRWSAVAGVVGAMVVGGYDLAADSFILQGIWLQASGLAVAVVAVLIAIKANTPEVVTTLAAAGIALCGTMWWRPCVGEELGAILSAAPTDFFGQMLPMTAYMLGAATPVAAIGLLYRLIDPKPAVALFIARIAAVGLIIVGGALALGQHDDLVAALTRWTLQ